MPRSFPDLKSLSGNAYGRCFRQPLPDESEQSYRQAFYAYMQHVDPVEAGEIRSGQGWDKMNPMDILAATLNRSKTAPTYVWKLAVIDLDPSVATNLHMAPNARGTMRINFEMIDKQRQYNYNENDENPYKAQVKDLYILAEPKGFEMLDTQSICGQYISAFQHKVTGEIYFVDLCRSFAICPYDARNCGLTGNDFITPNDIVETIRVAQEKEIPVIVTLPRDSFYFTDTMMEMEL